MLVEALKHEFSQDSQLEQTLFNPPASEAEIADFKAQLSAWNLPDLPDIFYAFYRWHNGSRDCEGYGYQALNGGWTVFSLAKILREKTMWDDLEKKDTFDNYERGTWWNRGWIPFLYMPDWWLGVIDTQGCFGGQLGQIITFDFKSADNKYVPYASFEQWLATILAIQQAGLLRWREGELLSVSDYKAIEQINQQINGNFAFEIETWRYRRKSAPENPDWPNLEQAIAEGNLEAVQNLVAEQKIDLSEQNLYTHRKFTPLLLALDSQAFAIADWLIQQGADLTQKDAYGRDAFETIVDAYDYGWGGDTLRYIDLMSSLLERGYVPEPNSMGSALTILAEKAVRSGNVLTVEFCLSVGVDVNKQCLLHELVKAAKPGQPKYLRMAKFLVQEGADVTLKNSDGKTARALFEEKFSSDQMFFRRYDDWIAVLSGLSQDLT